jgi:hypothetical protein
MRAFRKLCQRQIAVKLSAKKNASVDRLASCRLLNRVILFLLLLEQARLPLPELELPELHR